MNNDQRQPRPLPARLALAAAPALVLAAATAASAQIGIAPQVDPGAGASQAALELRPPAVGDIGGNSTILTYLAGIVLALAAWGLAVIPSRRTHQD